MSDASTPSSRRPLPFRRRADLVVEHIGFQGTGYWVVKDPIALKYHRLREEQYVVLEMLDAQQSLHGIRRVLVRRYPMIRPGLEDVQRLVVDLHEKGLVVSDRRGQGPEFLAKDRRERWKKVWQTLKSLLFVKLPGWDPERSLQVLLPWTRWCFRPAVFALAMLFVLSSLVLLLVNFDTFRSKLPEFQVFFAWPNVFYLWIALGLTKILHEFGHGLACKHFDSECHEMGVMLLVFSPTLYCDTSDSWMLRSKWQRIAIGAAGMYVEVVLSAFALWTWWFATDGLLGNLCLNVFFVTSVTTVVFNLNPLMRFDGYYMLSDLLEIPNLRQQADRMLKETAEWHCLGIEPRPDPFAPRHGRGWFVLFAIASWLYRWFLVIGIAMFLYTVLKPYDLQSIGIGLAVISLWGMVFNAVTSTYRTLTTPREEPLSRVRIGITLFVVGCVVAAILYIPVPLHVEAPFVLEPEGVQHVYTKVDGRLSGVSVAAGDDVLAGAELVRFENVQLAERLEELELEARTLTRRREAQRALGDAAAEATTEEQLRSIEARIEEIGRRLDELILRAPTAGRVVGTEPRPEPQVDEESTQLGQWHGTLLERRNVGASVEAGTQVLSLAPNDRFVAVLYVDQAIRNDVPDGGHVELKFDELPLQTFESTVGSISDRHDAFVPRALSNKFGGELPTLTDDQGRERLTDAAWRIVVPIRELRPSFRTGMRGRARFLVEDRTLGQWAWRAIRRTFQFQL